MSNASVDQLKGVRLSPLQVQSLARARHNYCYCTRLTYAALNLHYYRGLFQLATQFGRSDRVVLLFLQRRDVCKAETQN